MNKTNLPTDGFCIKVDMSDPLFLKCKKLLEESYKWSIHYTDNGLVSKYIGITNEGILFSLRKPNLYSKNKDNENIFTSYEFLEIVGEKPIAVIKFDEQNTVLVTETKSDKTLGEIENDKKTIILDTTIQANTIGANDVIDIYVKSGEDKEHPLITQLNEWIANCESTKIEFRKQGLTISEATSDAMFHAYKNCKEFFINNCLSNQPKKLTN